MNSFLEPFRNSILIKVVVFIAMLFYNFILNTQVDKKSNLFKILKSNNNVIAIYNRDHFIEDIQKKRC